MRESEQRCRHMSGDRGESQGVICRKYKPGPTVLLESGTETAARKLRLWSLALPRQKFGESPEPAKPRRWLGRLRWRGEPPCIEQVQLVPSAASVSVSFPATDEEDAEASRRPASVPAANIGPGECSSMMLASSSDSITSFSISASLTATNAGRRRSRISRVFSSDSATILRTSSSISRAVCSLCVCTVGTS